MKIFRIVPKQYAQNTFSGEGGLYVSGRWHSQGRKIIYTSQSASLAALEVLVNARKERQPDQYLIYSAEVPANLKIIKAKIKKSTTNWWRSYPHPSELKEIGDNWIEEGKSCIMEVPSVVMPTENNYILNPEHKDFTKIKISKPVSFSFDFRFLKISNLK